MSANSRNESESSVQQQQDSDHTIDTSSHKKYSEFNFSGDDSNNGNQSIKSELRRDVVSPPPQNIKRHKIFLSKNNPSNNNSGSVTNARFNTALTIPGHNPLPMSNTHKISKKYNAITSNKIQSQSIIQGTENIISTSNPTSSVTAVVSNTTIIPNKNKRHDNYNKNIYIGTKNAQKWEMLRTKLQCKNDVEFVTHLLNLMEKYSAFKKFEHIPTNSSTSSRHTFIDEQEELNLSINTSSASRNDFYNQVSQQVLRKSSPSSSSCIHSNSNHDDLRAVDHNNPLEDFGTGTEDSVAAEILDYRIAEKIENDLKAKESTLVAMIENVKLEKNGNGLCESIENVLPKTIVKKKKRLKNAEGSTKKLGGKQTNCWACGLKHEKGECPTDTPLLDIKDKLSLEIYRQIKAESGDATDNSVDSLPTFAEASLPLELEIITPDDETDKHGSSVFTKDFIPKYSRLGPLIGTIKEESDIADDSTLRFICETFDGTKSTYIDIEDRSTSNWIHFLKPAPTKDQKNCILKCFNDEVYFVTTVDIPAGAELVYWSGETNSSWTKKNSERTNCGGCNLRFDHLIYYRTHCSIFHDIGFSLTIKKYHCKICKISILGKENIMKHAEQMHDGKGAYQCQFCKKFFLRLNYLDMHRTYGCSANPDRARPLCDFCGRKFCQPQKLKVHIKRMHSDMTDVLRDFQCKMCSKLLGSRAALQRHSKEVHNRESGYVNCPRCQKLFQNRSNLKIHMLTHSGVRPFKCAESECNAAFTTKQCLQFHYKKVHGYTQEQMPKIERSVAYTFDAYSGGLKGETIDLDEKMFKPRKRREKSINVPTNSTAENLSEIIDSCKEALELRKHMIDDNNSIGTSQFNDYDEDSIATSQSNMENVDQTLQQSSIEQPMQQVQDEHGDQGQNLGKTSVVPTENVEDVDDKSMNDDELDLYQGSDEENLHSNEGNARSNSEAINEISQYPFNFIPNRQDEATNITQSNYNPLASAFSAHPQSSILNFFNAANKNRGGLPTSAMLVEAALNSVSDASNEFIENVPSGDDNNIDIESVSHKNANTATQLEPHSNYISDENSADDQDFNNKNGHASLSGSSAASIESKKSEMPLDVTFNPTRKHFQIENYTDADDRSEFNVSCVKNSTTSSFMPQREFFGGTNTSGGNITTVNESSEHEMNFPLQHEYKKYDKCFQYLEEMKNLNETLKDVHKRDTMSVNSVQESCHFPNLQGKLKPTLDDLHAMNKLLPNELDLKFKTNRKDMLDNATDFRNNFSNTLTSNQMYNLNFKGANEFHNELSMPQNTLNYNRYQHHIHDILSSEKEQVHQSAAIDSHVTASQTQQEMHSSYLEHHLHSSNYTDHSEQQSINLCKNSNEYSNCMSPMPQNYASHSAEMLRMTSSASAQDLCTNMTSSYMNSNPSPPNIHHAPSFLNTQLNPHHNNRETLTDHHRLLASEKFVASRLLVDPVAHRFIEQQHRFLGSNADNNKIEQTKSAALGLSLYHQQIPTHQAYHHDTKSTSTNNLHTNYHHLPFSAYYQ